MVNRQNIWNIQKHTVQNNWLSNDWFGVPVRRREGERTGIKIFRDKWILITNNLKTLLHNFESSISKIH